MRCGLACANTRGGRLVAARAATPPAINWRRLRPVATKGLLQQLQIADSRRLVDCDIILSDIILFLPSPAKTAGIFYMFPLSPCRVKGWLAFAEPRHRAPMMPVIWNLPRKPACAMPTLTTTSHERIAWEVMTRRQQCVQ